MPRRLQLDGPSVQEVVDNARETYGPDVKILGIERVITGGIGGFFGRAHYEVTVEVPAEPAGARRLPGVQPVVFDEPARAGIAALLHDADVEDDLGPEPPAAVAVSTDRDDFNALLAGLVADTSATPHTPEPAPSSGAGDLVALVGLGDDAVRVAREMSLERGMLLAAAGCAATAQDVRRVDDARAALEARAEGVRAGRATAVAVGIGIDAVTVEGLLAALSPEQVWVVVDVSRKADDTEFWVGRVARLTRPHAVAVVGAEHTRTPGTGQQLGLPVGWTGPGRAGVVPAA